MKRTAEQWALTVESNGDLLTPSDWNDLAALLRAMVAEREALAELVYDLTGNDNAKIYRQQDQVQAATAARRRAEGHDG
jgi:hypothetical protein